jgi:hydrogenase maturation factor
MERIVYRRLGAKRPEVLVGPRRGVDNAVVGLNGDRVIVTTTDPVSIIPALGLEDSAWLSVHHISSDLATSAIAPAYALFELNLPPHLRDTDFMTYWRALHKECLGLGIAVVGGHSGRFAGCDYTIVGSGTMFATGRTSQFVTSAMAQPDDVLVVTKGAAIATASILARTFPRTVEKASGSRGLRRAQGLFRQISTIEDALTASAVGVRDAGVGAMHDAAEGGVLTALHELVDASECGAYIDQAAIPLVPEVQDVCSLFGIDPFFALAEGALVAAVREHAVEKVLRALRGRGIQSAAVGRVRQRDAGIRVRDPEGERVLSPPPVDAYWSAYARAVRQGWR